MSQDYRYCTPEEVLGKLSHDELTQLTDDDRAAIPDQGVLSLLIADATAEIDAYARKGGAVVPLTDLNFRRYLATSLVTCHLLARRNIIQEARQKQCDQIYKTLESLSKGEIIVEDETAPVAVGVIRDDREYYFTDDSLYYY